MPYLTWAVSKYVSGSWQSDGTVPVPRGQSFSEIIASSIQEIDLADASKAAIIPETKSNKSAIKLFWHRAEVALKTNLETYIQAGTGLKVTTHVSGKIFEGYITNIESEIIIGQSREQYNVSIDFMQKVVA